MKINPLTDKIVAIKALRDFSRDTYGLMLDLRTCKEAIEQLQAKMTPLTLSYDERQHIGSVIQDYINEYTEAENLASREYSLRDQILQFTRTLKA